MTQVSVTGSPASHPWLARFLQILALYHLSSSSDINSCPVSAIVFLTSCWTTTTRHHYSSSTQSSHRRIRRNHARGLLRNVLDRNSNSQEGQKGQNKRSLILVQEGREQLLP